MATADTGWQTCRSISTAHSTAARPQHTHEFPADSALAVQLLREGKWSAYEHVCLNNKHKYPSCMQAGPVLYACAAVTVVVVLPVNRRPLGEAAYLAVCKEPASAEQAGWCYGPADVQCCWDLCQPGCPARPSCWCCWPDAAGKRVGG